MIDTLTQQLTGATYDVAGVRDALSKSVDQLRRADLAACVPLVEEFGVWLSKEI
jgi:hypothetical protein